MADVATWIGNIVLTLSGIAAVCGAAWGVTELAWRQVKRLQGFATIVKALRAADKRPKLTSVEPDGWVVRYPNGDEAVTGWPTDGATRVEPVYARSTLEESGIVVATDGVKVAHDQPLSPSPTDGSAKDNQALRTLSRLSDEMGEEL